MLDLGKGVSNDKILEKGEYFRICGSSWLIWYNKNLKCFLSTNGIRINGRIYTNKEPVLSKCGAITNMKEGEFIGLYLLEQTISGKKSSYIIPSYAGTHGCRNLNEELDFNNYIRGFKRLTA